MILPRRGPGALTVSTTTFYPTLYGVCDVRRKQSDGLRWGESHVRHFVGGEDVLVGFTRSTDTPVACAVFSVGAVFVSIFRICIRNGAIPR